MKIAMLWIQPWGRRGGVWAQPRRGAYAHTGAHRRSPAQRPRSTAARGGAACGRGGEGDTYRPKLPSSGRSEGKTQKKVKEKKKKRQQAWVPENAKVLRGCSVACRSCLVAAFVCTVSVLVLTVWGWLLAWCELPLLAADRLLLASIRNSPFTEDVEGFCSFKL